MKRIFGTLAFLSFFWLLGTVAAVEQDMMALGTGTLHMALALFVNWPECFTYAEKEKPQTGVQSHPRQA